MPNIALLPRGFVPSAGQDRRLLSFAKTWKERSILSVVSRMGDGLYRAPVRHLDAGMATGQTCFGEVGSRR